MVFHSYILLIYILNLYHIFILFMSFCTDWQLWPSCSDIVKPSDPEGDNKLLKVLSDSKSVLMAFGDRVWSVSVSGSVLSQATADFLWNAEGVGLGQRQTGIFEAFGREVGVGGW